MDIHITATGINNLKNIDILLPLEKIICFTGKSGSGKSTLAFDVIYKAGISRVWKTKQYTISEIPEVLALQQKTRVSLSTVSVSKYLGLATYLKDHHLGTVCTHCDGNGVEISIKQAILDTANAFNKLNQIDELKYVCDIISRRGDVQKALREVFEKYSSDENMRAVLSNVATIQSCPYCAGLGVKADDKAISSFFAHILPNIFDTLDALRAIIEFGQPVNTVGNGNWQWIRLLKLLLKVKPHGIVILDEPMAGMTVGDGRRLMSVIHRLVKFYSNTVILVEHAQSAILGSDYILEMGPGSGRQGGHVVFLGTTSEYLDKCTDISKQLPICQTKRMMSVKTVRMATVSGINEFGFRNEQIRFPLLKLTCISGNSQTGKTGLLNVLARAFDKGPLGWCERLGLGNIQGRSDIRRVESVSQTPIGNNPHSIPITYINAMTSLRTCFFDICSDSSIPFEAFSFNSDKGWCPICCGAGGEIQENESVCRWEICPSCGGNRYNKMVRGVLYNGLNIGDFLRLTMNELETYSAFCPLVLKKTRLIAKIGLGYLPLGQPSATLSGGEAQRIKLGKYLAKQSGDRTLYILDNPSKGLSVSDIPLLIAVLKELSKKNTVVVADNHPMFFNECDYLIWLQRSGNRNSIAFADFPKAFPKKHIQDMFGG